MSKPTWRKWTLVLVVAIATLPGLAGAQPYLRRPTPKPLPTPLPGNASGQMPSEAEWALNRAPPELKAYLQAAKRADQITDPLARCIAFPDYPGSHWPAGLVAQQCGLENGPKVGFWKMRELVDADKTAQLDAMLKAHLDQHFSTKNFSEIIHADFAQFNASDDSDKLSKDWLAKAPNSAYAAMARGAFYEALAYKSRGTGWASDTAPEAMQKMHEYAAKADVELRRAVTLEPRLMPAYVSLLNLAKTESDDEAMEWAWATGNKRDSACSALTRAQMVSLEPRWGGSYSQMREFAQALTPETPRRPLLANVTVLSKTDAADVLGRAKRYDEAEAMLKEGIADSSDPGLFESLARYHNRAGMPLSVESLSYLIAASRFRDCDCDSSYVARERGEWLVVLLRDPEWARISLERTAARIPKDMDVQMLLANVDWQGGDTVAAEAIYVRAMDIPQYRERALREMVAMFMNSRSQAKANKYNDLYIKEHPSDAWAYYQRAQISQQYDTTGRAAMEVQLAALEHFLLISQGAVPPHVEGARKQSIYRVAQIKEQLKVLGVAK